MRLILYFARRYPWQTVFTALALLLMTGFEALGISLMVPVLSIGARMSGLEASEDAVEPSGFEARVVGAVEWTGLEPTLATLIPAAIFVFWLKAGALVLAYRQIAFTVARVSTDLRLDLLRALMSARWGYYTHQPAGAAANAVATETERASYAYLESARIIAQLTESAVYIALALAISVPAMLVTAAAALMTLVALNALVRVSARAGEKQTRLLNSLLGRLTDTLGAVKVLKATARENLVRPILERDTLKLNRALRKQVLSREALRALQEAILFTIGLAVAWVALARLRIDFVHVLVILFLFQRTLQSVNKAQRRWQHMASDASALWSLQSLVERARAHREELHGGREPSLSRGISLEGVALRYDEAQVLRDLDLEIPAGRITAIVGPSGTGKTTIVDLVTALIEPDAGRICVDGVPLTEIDLSRWRSQIGYVPQEMLMLHDSVRANVSLGDPRISDAEVEQALRDAGAWEFVSQLPEGLNSSVGERGTLLSGGQRQRIAIARALVHAPRLLILDEATAALDPATEAAVWSTVERLRGRTTILAISHQPALTGVADRVYRVQDGRAVDITDGDASRVAQA